MPDLEDPKWRDFLAEKCRERGGSPHPMIGTRWEQDRCPDCGTPGVQIGELWPFLNMACPECEPELLAGHHGG